MKDRPWRLRRSVHGQWRSAHDEESVHSKQKRSDCGEWRSDYCEWRSDQRSDHGKQKRNDHGKQLSIEKRDGDASSYDIEKIQKNYHRQRKIDDVERSDGDAYLADAEERIRNQYIHFSYSGCYAVLLG